MSVEAATASIMRRIWKGISKESITKVNGIFPMEVADYIQNRKRKELASLEKRYGVTIEISGDHSLPPGGEKIDFIKDEGWIHMKWLSLD